MGPGASAGTTPRRAYAPCPALLRGLHVGGVEEAARLPAPERRVVALEAQQRRVGALLDDAAAIEHHQTVHAGDGGEPVRDRDHALARHQGVEARLDGGLDLAVER